MFIYDTHHIRTPSFFQYAMKLARRLAPERIMRLVQVHAQYREEDSVAVPMGLMAAFGPEMLPPDLGGSSNEAANGDAINRKLVEHEAYFVDVKNSTATS